MALVTSSRSLLAAVRLETRIVAARAQRDVAWLVTSTALQAAVVRGVTGALLTGPGLFVCHHIIACKGPTTPISKFGTGIESLETRLENAWTLGDESGMSLESGIACMLYGVWDESGLFGDGLNFFGRAWSALERRALGANALLSQCAHDAAIFMSFGHLCRSAFVPMSRICADRNLCRSTCGKKCTTFVRMSACKVPRMHACATITCYLLKRVPRLSGLGAKGTNAWR